MNERGERPGYINCHRVGLRQSCGHFCKAVDVCHCSLAHDWRLAAASACLLALARIGDRLVSFRAVLHLLLALLTYTFVSCSATLPVPPVRDASNTVLSAPDIGINRSWSSATPILRLSRSARSAPPCHSPLAASHRRLPLRLRHPMEECSRRRLSLRTGTSSSPPQRTSSWSTAQITMRRLRSSGRCMNIGRLTPFPSSLMSTQTLTSSKTCIATTQMMGPSSGPPISFLAPT